MIGYREWNIVYNPEMNQFRLSSIAASSIIWEREMAAVCSQGKLEEHLRNFEHVCGLYSYRSPKFLLAERYPSLGTVCGSVYNYGIIAQYSEGFRSSHAVIDALFSPPYTCARAWFSPTPIPECHKPVEFFGTGRLYRRPRFHFYPTACFCLEHMEKERPRLGRVAPVEAVLKAISDHYGIPVRRWEELWKWV